MRHLTFTLCMLVALSYSYAQDSAYPKVPFTSLTGVTATGDMIIAAGSCGLVMYSSDGGSSWSHMEIEEDYYEVDDVPLSAGTEAYLSTRQEIFIVDVESEMVRSSGVTSNSLISGNIVDLHTEGSKAIVIGTIGVFEGSSDLEDMQLLAELSYDSDDRIISTSVTDSYVWIGLKKGEVLKVDRSSGELVVAYDAGEDLRTMTFGSDDVGYMGASSGSKIFKTSDGAATWSQLSSFSEVATLHAYGDDVIISQNTNRLLVSIDGGTSTEYVPYPSEGLSAYLEDIVVDGDGVLYMVGQASTVLRSTDFGLTYDNLNAYPRETIYDMGFGEDGTVGFALGYYSTLLITEDGGDSWTAADIEYSQSNPSMNGGVVMDDNTILVCTELGIKVANKDGVLTDYSDETLERMMYNQQEDYLLGVKYQGGNWLVRKSVDRGITWDNKVLLPDYGYTWGASPIGLVIIAIDDESYMVSRDHGESWTQESHDFAGYVNSISFYDSEHALLSAGNQLYKTTDGTESWQPISTGYLQTNTQMLSEEHYVFTSAQNFVTTVKESRDGGESWDIIDSYCSQSYRSAMSGDRYWMGQRFGHLNFTQITPITSAGETTLSNLKLTNNLVQRGGLLYLETTDVQQAEVAVVDAMGNLVDVEAISTSDGVQISTADIHPGLYFVTVVDGAHQRALRFIVH